MRLLHFLGKKISFILIIYPINLFSQVVIGENSPKARGALEVHSQMINNYLGGIVLPKVKDVSLVRAPKGKSPVEGTIVYDISKGCIRIFSPNQKTKHLEWSSCLDES